MKAQTKSKIVSQKGNRIWRPIKKRMFNRKLFEEELAASAGNYYSSIATNTSGPEYSASGVPYDDKTVGFS